MDEIASRHLFLLRPKGGFTRRQFRARTGLNAYHAAKVLNAEVEAGRLRCGLFPRGDGTGGTEMVYYPPPLSENEA